MKFAVYFAQFAEQLDLFRIFATFPIEIPALRGMSRLLIDDLKAWSDAMRLET